MDNCKVCDEKYNKRGRKRIRCSGCDYDQCQECVKKYLLGIREIESKCMNCNVEWKRDFIKKNLPKTYLEGEYKEEQKKKIFDEERQHFPTLMEEIEGYKRTHLLIKEQNENRDKWGEMRKRKEQVISQRQIYSREIQEEMICPSCIQKECGQKIEERVYKYVTEENKKEEEKIYCRKCEKEICQYCLSMIEEENEHRCVEKDERKVKEIDKELEEYQGKIKELQQENKVIKEKIQEIESVQNSDTGEKNKVQRNYYIHCPQKDCNGYIDNKRDKCGVCSTKICKRCNEENTESHKCKQENVQSAKKIRSQCRQCPGCKTQIYKIEGCNDMYCVICKISFDWKTGEQTKQTGNPHYYEYLRQRNVWERGQDIWSNGGMLQVPTLLPQLYVPYPIVNIEQLNQRLQEIRNRYNCNNLVEGDQLERNIRKYINEEEESYKKIIEIHAEVIHVERTKIVDIQCRIRQTQNKEDCMQYLVRKIEKEELMKRLYTNRKNNEKLRDFQQILEAYIEVCKEKLNEISEERNKEMIVEKLEVMKKFKEYIKEQIEKTKKDYDSKMRVL